MVWTTLLKSPNPSHLTTLPHAHTPTSPIHYPHSNPRNPARSPTSLNEAEASFPGLHLATDKDNRSPVVRGIRPTLVGYVCYNFYLQINLWQPDLCLDLRDLVLSTIYVF